MKTVINIHDGEIKRHLEYVALRTKRSLEGLVLTAARVAVNAFGPGTSGQGYSFPKSQEVGVVAVENQIRRVYATPSKVFAMMRDYSAGMAADYWKHVKARRWNDARDLMARCPTTAHLIRTDWDGGAAHTTLHRRDKRGRISKRQRPVVAIENTKLLDRYVRYMVKRVGFTQRGWYVCAKELGAKNVVKFSGGFGGEQRGTGEDAAWPKWIINRPGKPQIKNGKTEIKLDAWKSTVSFTNTTPWASQVLAPGTKTFVEKIARDRLIAYCRKAVAEIDAGRKPSKIA